MLYDKILYEGPQARTRVVRFFVLISFATIIAAMGVITDSTAVVIGTMLIAPLMTPLTGMAISLVMGWPNRLARSALIAFGGIVAAIAIGAFLGLTLPTVIDTATNGQILARTTPTVLDLITAMAAGAAGAYRLSRPDVSDALPGVAIAISLFATNMIAILIVGGITFVLTGVTPISRVAASQQRVATGIAVTICGGLLVLFALLLNGAQTTADVLQRGQVEQTVAAWLKDDPAHRVSRIAMQDGTVAITVVGPAASLPDTQPLAEGLAETLSRPVDVRVSLVVEEVIETRSR